MTRNLKTLGQEAEQAQLSIVGAFKPTPDYGETLILLGPGEPRFWTTFSASPEYHNRVQNPLDSWSKRVIGALAGTWDGTAYFPSDGPNYPPFIQWALDSGRCWVSPAGLLVHDTAGLLISFRGAIALPYAVDLPTPTNASPCETCLGKQCTNACPVTALSPTGYDVPACTSHVLTADTASCRSKGCAARRACPISKTYPRLEEQSAFHMKAFLGQ